MEINCLLKKAYPLLMGLALRQTRNKEDAEDIVQETMLRAWKFLSSYEERGNFEGWLCRIEERCFLNWWRSMNVVRHQDKHHSLDHYPSSVLLAETPAFEGGTLQGLDDKLYGAVMGVEESFRVPLLLREFGELTYEEISERTGAPRGTVMSRIFRAREKLRRNYLEGGD